MISRSQPDLVVIIDLRAQSLLALSRMRHHGRATLVTIAERYASVNVVTIIVVATPQIQEEIRHLVAVVSPECRVVTLENISAQSCYFGGGHIVWLRSLVLHLDDADIERLAAEHDANLCAESSRAVSAISSSAVPGAASLVGWIAAAEELPVLLEYAVQSGRTAAKPTVWIDRPVLLDIEGLASLVRYERRLRAEALVLQGVDLRDWASLEVAGDLRCSPGVTIGSHVTIEGRVEIDSGATIGAYTYLRNARIGSNSEIKAYSSLEDVQIGANCRVGPYARLRTQTVIDNGVSIGNFVELKATKVGSGGRINHFGFLGDALLQSNVTIGAGVITCNHDGEKSAVTHIEAGAYVGSGSELVAPLIVGKDSTIAAGSTITEDVDPGGLTLARAKQVRVEQWKRKGGK